jgi:flagellar biosynthesis protein FlhA
VSQALASPEKIRGGDVAVPLGIIGVVLMMVLPLPPALLDLLLAFSMALAIGIFLTALFIKEALEFSAFPAFVLVATLLRLSLNVATTRLVLLHGGEGQGAAGSVVEAFGRFVVEGNLLVGLVVFLILAVINFVVVTKGAGRVAEVAARFTLDAMPGKQMAIDADLSSGVITADEARARRKSLEREADFYGAMDGASKFVHGDAIAGLLITGVNLIGGLLLGVSRGMDLAQAAETFSVLSVGDALVSQIPALLVSAAAGVVVTRSATGEQLGRAFGTQLFRRRQSVVLTAVILAALALLPGLPALPCLVLAGALGLLARKLPKHGAPPEAAKAEAPPRSASDDIESALTVHLLTLEVGYELLAAVDASRGGTLLTRVATLRQQLARELGIVLPPVHVCDNLDLAPGEYRILVSGNPVAKGACRAARLLAIAPTGPAAPLEGEATREPAFGQPAIWIPARDREMAEALGYTVVDHATMITTHLAEVIRGEAARLLGRQEMQHLLDVLAKSNPKLVDDLVPALLSIGDVLRVVRNLLREHVSIRDLRTILEALADGAVQTKDPEQLTEMVRERLAAQMTSRLRGSDGSVAVMVLDAHLEEVLRRSLRDIAAGTGGALPPDLVRSLTDEATRAVDKFAALGAVPALLTAPDLRRYVRAIFERKHPRLIVASFREIEPNVSLRVLATLGTRPDTKEIRA